MTTLKITLAFLGVTLLGGLIFQSYLNLHEPITGAPPYGEAENQVPDLDPLDWRTTWVRPAGPAKVGLQVGHWHNDKVPDELIRLKGNTGASGGGKAEWEVNLAIAQRVKQLLETEGIQVDLLPATVPPRYWSDVFVAIHADGSHDTTVTGYKFASPWRDMSGKASTLVEILEKNYELSTQLVKDPNITRNMRGYYAFAWWRYEHAIHPMTTAAIAETGFLTNPKDRQIIVANYEKSAHGIAQGILEYLKVQKLV